MSDNPLVGLTQADLNQRLIQNDDEFRNKINTLCITMAKINTTLDIHLDSEKKATNIKLAIMGIVIGAGSSILAVFV